jgi:hypothetical protein
MGMILRNLGMINNDRTFCVILSHFFVEKGQEYKFDVLEYVVNFYKSMNKFVILSGHGEVSIPKLLMSQIDKVYWEKSIDRREIGRGHPKFCMKGFEIAKKNGFSVILKMRAEDILLLGDMNRRLYSLLSDKKILVSEQTNMIRGRLGDLFMFGDLDFIHGLWRRLPWDYSKNGLYNLFRNFDDMSLNINVNQFIQEHCNYKTPQTLGWVTVTDAWDFEKKEVKNLETCLWGKKPGHAYYGGF